MNMGYRTMRVIVMFDLPMQTSKERRDYRRFRNFLIDHGFLMLQQSVYAKLAITPSVARSIRNEVMKASPRGGLVQMINVTEKQYNQMDYVVGDATHKTLDTSESLVIF